MAYQEVSTDKPALPEYLARKGKKRMSQEDLRAVVSHAVSQSVQFVDTELSVERARATEFYLGKPFGNEEEGRSQVVLTEVRDAVDGMLPSFMRIFFGAEHTVEFEPNKADAVEDAAQRTDYVRYVYEEDNAGFLNTLSVLKDGLIRKIGILKWGWDDSVDTKAYKQQGLTYEQMELLAEDDDVDLKVASKLPPTKEMLADFKKAQEQYQQMIAQSQAQAPPVAPAGPTAPGASTQAGPPAAPPLPPAPVLPVYYDVEFTRTQKGGRLRVWTLPPEEFIYNRQARSLDEAMLVGHRTDKTRGQLLAMGISEKDIDEHAGAGNDTDVTLKGNAEEIARRDVAGVGRVVGFGYTNDPDMGTANDKILYGEFFMTIDCDGDGVAELRKICTIGPTYYPVSNDPVPDRCFALFTPYPEPHTLQGGSVSDRTMDIQKIDSSILRAILDSGAASIFPRTVYTEGQASVADIMNTAIGAPIRERTLNSVRILETPFTGDKMMPVLQFMQEVVERRTGQSKGAAGLDDDALQSTGKEAVGAHLVASQAQIELIARVFAEQCYKPMFKGLARLLAERQQRSRMVKLRGHYVEVDPRQWMDDMNVTCNVGLGSTFIERKVATLIGVASDQKEILMTLGMQNPLVTLPMLRNTRAKILALQGIKDVDSYYNPLPMDWQPPAPPQPQPTPDQVMAQAEMEMEKLKTTKDLAIKQDELTLKHRTEDRAAEQQRWEQAFEERKLASDEALRRYATEAQFHATMSEAQLRANIDMEDSAARLALDTHGQLHDQAMDRGALANDTASTASDMLPDPTETAEEPAAPEPAPAPEPPPPPDFTPVVGALGDVAKSMMLLAVKEPPSQAPVVAALEKAAAAMTALAQKESSTPKEVKRKGRKAKITAPDGSVHTIETMGDE